MPTEMQGRRSPLMKPGDYFGPDDGKFTNGIPAVWYLLPIALDDNVPSNAKRLHYVISPPHQFIEESDGSLTIRESIGAGCWHGYLTEGRWELNKSK